MKVAVLSDIHSNYQAFQAVFTDAVKRQVDQFIFLGDYVSDLAEPQKTLDLVYAIQASYPTFCIRGNREKYMLDCLNGNMQFSVGSKSGSLLFTYQHLRMKDLAFFESMKIYDIIEIGGVQIEIAHAIAEDDRYYFDSESENLHTVFKQMKCKYLLTGHSHKQYWKRHLDQVIINPGSVGLPQDNNWLAEYVILNVNSNHVDWTFYRVPYDLKRAIHIQFSSGLVHIAKYWAIGILYDLITGKDLVIQLLLQVDKEDGDPSENDWRLAATKLGMSFTEQEVLDYCEKYLKQTAK